MEWPKKVSYEEIQEVGQSQWLLKSMDLYLELTDLLSVQENIEIFEIFQISLKLMSISPCGLKDTYELESYCHWQLWNYPKS